MRECMFLSELDHSSPPDHVFLHEPLYRLDQRSKASVRGCAAHIDGGGGLRVFEDECGRLDGLGTTYQFRGLLNAQGGHTHDTNTITIPRDDRDFAAALAVESGSRGRGEWLLVHRGLCELLTLQQRKPCWRSS